MEKPKGWMRIWTIRNGKAQSIMFPSLWRFVIWNLANDYRHAVERLIRSIKE